MLQSEGKIIKQMQQRAEGTVNCEGLFRGKHNKLQMQMEAVATMEKGGRGGERRKRKSCLQLKRRRWKAKLEKSSFYLLEKCQN